MVVTSIVVIITVTCSLHSSSLLIHMQHMVCRKEMGIDTLLEWTPPEVLVKFAVGGHFGEDRDGHPIFYNNYGNADMRGILRGVCHEN